MFHVNLAELKCFEEKLEKLQKFVNNKNETLGSLKSTISKQR